MTTARTPRPAIGKHPAVLRFAQIQEPQDATWSHQVILSFELIAPDPEAGMYTSYFGSLSEEANDKGNRPIDWTVNALRNCGWTGDDLAELPELAKADRLTEIVELVVEHRPNSKGELVAKVIFVNRPGGGGMIKLERVLEGDDLKNFGRRFRTSIASAGTQPAAKKPAPAPARTQQRTAPPRGSQPQRSDFVDDDTPPFGDTPPPDEADFLRG